MSMEKSHEFAGHILNDVGAVVAKELDKIINDPEHPLEPGLKFVLAHSFAGYSPIMINQMGLLLEEPKFKTTGKLASHFSYELSMVKNILINEKKVKELLDGDSQMIADLVFAILVSDIGKAGPMEVREGQPSAVVRRIYNQAIFTEQHEEWLKHTDVGKWPEEIRVLVEAMSEEDRKTVFVKGAFFPLPIDAYMYVVRQVAIDSANGQEDKIREANNLLSFTKEEREFLLAINVDSEKLPIRSFFSNSHIRFGRIFLSREDLLDDDQRRMVPTALSHHFSQAVLPKGMTAEIIMSNRKMLLEVAFLEILDKFDAFYCRFKDAGREIARESTWKLISRSLNFNYPQYPELLETYDGMFKAMIDSEII